MTHETIYMSLFVQGRGALRHELFRCLRQGQAIRRPKGTRLPTGKGIINDMVMISERPAEVDDRAVPGHWEGDLILGKGQRAIGTLVERSTRYVMLFRLPDGHGAPAVRKALAKRIATLPTELRRSITWDQGKEMASPRRPPATSTSAAPAPRSTTGCSPASTAARSSCASRTPTPSATARSGSTDHRRRHAVARPRLGRGPYFQSARATSTPSRPTSCGPPAGSTAASCTRG